MANKIIQMDITPGSGIVSIFQYESYRIERVFSEFIDNSLQSFLDHAEELKRMPSGGACKVDIWWKGDKITITDNAYGMNEEEFGRALKPKSDNPQGNMEDRLSVYGIGLNYASAYLGKVLHLVSTRYKCYERYEAEINIDVLNAENTPTAPVSVSSDDMETHETIVTITQLTKKLTQGKEEALIQKLALIYRYYISQGDLILRFNGHKVQYERPEIRVDDNGERYHRNFESSFFVNGKEFRYSGWVGILPKGRQEITGLNLFQAHRCIEIGWSHKDIFGSGNSFQNSRVVGEVFLSGITLSFTKDKFVWADDGTEDAFVKSLMANENFAYIIGVCKTLKKEEDGDKIITQTTAESFGSLGLDFITSEDELKPKVRERRKKKSPAEEKPKPSETKKPGMEGRPLTQEELEAIHVPSDSLPPMINDIPDSASQAEPSTDSQIEAEEEEANPEERSFPKVFVDVGEKKAAIYINSFAGRPGEDWASLSEYKDGFLLSLNYKNRFIAKNFKKDKGAILANRLGIAIVAAVLRAQENGVSLKYGGMLLSSINEVFGSNGEDE